MILNKLEMEFLGTFIFTYIIGFLYVQHSLEYITLFELAVGAFCIYSVLLWVGCAVSGSQYNPAITLNLMFSRHIAVHKGMLYIFFQMFASIFAICLLRLCLTSEDLNRLNDSTMLGFPINDQVKLFEKIVIEVIGSFFLVFSYYMLILEKTAPKYVYGAGIAGVFCFVLLFSHKYSGAGLNPARMIAYAIISRKYSTSIIYILGTLIGGILGSILGNLLLSEKAMISKLKRLRKKEKKFRKQREKKKK